MAREGLGASRSTKRRAFEAEALRTLGEIQARHEAEQWAAASQSYREAADLAEDLGMRPLVAHCHLGFGKLYCATNERERAREHFTTAATMYREMGMRYWLESVERELESLTGR